MSQADDRFADLAGLQVSELCTRLGTTAEGLSDDEARARLARFGPNTIASARRRGFLAWRFLKQFTHFLAILLWIAAALAFLAEMLQPGEGMATLGWAVLGVIVINAAFAFVQEYRAERALQALHRLLPTTAWVQRAGQVVQVPRQGIVPGDVLILEEGEQVAADARLVDAAGMRTDDSSLTGESRPKRRSAEPCAARATLDVPNMVFAGTTVVAGRGRAVVYATGMRTEFGAIARLATTTTSERTPLQREIARVTHVVAILACTMGALFFAIGIATGMGFWMSAVFGIGIIVANVPEGLLPTVTLALAMGSQRMAKRQALIKQLVSVETLGCTTIICTDKTGTLTQNRMRVEQLYVDATEVEVRDGALWIAGRAAPGAASGSWELLLRAVALCNNARRVAGRGSVATYAGDPTEIALAEFAAEHGGASAERWPRMRELPFDADRKRMTTLHWVEGRLVAFVKGAPEGLVPLCTWISERGEERAFRREEAERALERSREFAARAYRVLAVAMREIPLGQEALDAEGVERELAFLGLVAMLDPPHPEVPEAIARCRQAGVRVVMVTGDHALTALAIAAKVGMIPGGQECSDRVVDGAALDAMDDGELRRLLTPAAAGAPDPVFARLTPRHKLRIVAVLEDMGHVVAVTGDGVNDAPALKRADIGIAMGVAGTDVAKETADMILLDDNFATIVNAIEEGRTVYANIRKFVTYVLSSNVPEIVPYLAYGLLPVPLPLTVPQILAVDLGTDMLPALALGAEPPQPGVMARPPRPPAERLLSPPLLLRAYGFLGAIEAAIAMACFFGFLARAGWSWGTRLPASDPVYRQATACTLAAIVVAQVANVFVCRSERLSAFTLRFGSNRIILAGIAVEIGLLLTIVYTPAGNALFQTAPLPAAVWPVFACGAIALFFAEELRKVFVRRRSRG